MASKPGGSTRTQRRAESRARAREARAFIEAPTSSTEPVVANDDEEHEVVKVHPVAPPTPPGLEENALKRQRKEETVFLQSKTGLSRFTASLPDEFWGLK